MKNIVARLILVLEVFLYGWGLQSGLKNKRVHLVGSYKSFVFYKNKSPFMYWMTIAMWVF